MLICDPINCHKTEKTIDIRINDLSSNKKLLVKLNLVSNMVDYGPGWFNSYLSAFNLDNCNDILEKLNTNPIVRILISSDEMLESIKN